MHRNQVQVTVDLAQHVTAHERDRHEGARRSSSWSSIVPLMLVSTALFSGCGEPDPVPVVASCSDGLRNGTESDTDCGGSCGACALFQGCVTAADCIEGVCTSGACRAPRCDDGVPNGTETDVDCGSSCPPCATGQMCSTHSDCAEGVCRGDCSAPSCSDETQNGTETDVDCGGGCGPCVRGQVCADSADCSDSVCFEGVCERALVITGMAKPTESLVGVYTSQSIIRVDFAAAPTVTNFDGTALTLPVSSGTFVSGNIAGAFAPAEVRVNGVVLASPTGSSTYQSISPDYFGVVLGLSDEASAVANYNALLEEGIDGTAVEIVILDTTP